MASSRGPERKFSIICDADRDGRLTFLVRVIKLGVVLPPELAPNDKQKTTDELFDTSSSMTR